MYIKRGELVHRGGRLAIHRAVKGKSYDAKVTEKSFTESELKRDELFLLELNGDAFLVHQDELVDAWAHVMNSVFGTKAYTVQPGICAEIESSPSFLVHPMFVFGLVVSVAVVSAVAWLW